jgi:hypothetical protein
VYELEDNMLNGIKAGRLCSGNLGEILLVDLPKVSHLLTKRKKSLGLKADGDILFIRLIFNHTLINIDNGTDREFAKSLSEVLPTHFIVIITYCSTAQYGNYA